MADISIYAGLNENILKRNTDYVMGEHAHVGCYEYLLSQNMQMDMHMMV